MEEKTLINIFKCNPEPSGCEGEKITTKPPHFRVRGPSAGENFRVTEKDTTSPLDAIQVKQGTP